MLEAVRTARYSFWVGSGVSRDQFPSVPALMERLLRSLHDSAAPDDPTCPYCAALIEIFNIAQIPLVEVDLTRGPAAWPLDAITTRMAQQYADVLDVAVREPAGTLDLVWDVLQLPGLYSDPAVRPGPEHFLLALLVEEGVVPRLVTTNWDTLIETAHRELAPAHPMRSIASNDELAQDHSPTVFKIHGCARKASDDPPSYRPFFLATELQIVGWGDNDLTRPFQEYANTVMRQYRTLFIGLSGQDVNLRIVFDHAALGRQTEYPGVPPQIAFSATYIDHRRRSILERAYSDYQERQPEIDPAACLAPCAKALLGTFLLDTWVSKVALLISDAADDGGFPPPLLVLLREWRDAMEAEVCERVDNADGDAGWQWLARDLPRIMSHVTHLVRHGSWLPTDDVYEPLLGEDLAKLSARSPLRAAVRGHWLLLGLAALWKGSNPAYWSVRAGRPRGAGITGCSFVIERPDGNIGLLVAENSDGAAVRLEREGVLGPDIASHVIVLYPQGHRPRDLHRRSLTRSMPGPSDGGPFEVWLQDVLSNDPVELLDGLRDEFLAAEAVLP